MWPRPSFARSHSRVLHGRRRLTALALAAPLLLSADHVRYLYSDTVDYDYNMKVNVFFGMLSPSATDYGICLYRILLTHIE